MDSFFEKAGEFYDHYTSEVLDRDAAVAGIKEELGEMTDFQVFERRRRADKPPGEPLLSTKVFRQRRSDNTVRSRIVARQFAETYAPEHHIGTPPTWLLKIVLSRVIN